MKSKEQISPSRPLSAEQVMVNHLAAMVGRSKSARWIHRSTIQEFLSYCCEIRKQPADRLRLNRQQLLRWLIHVCAGKVPEYARQRLFILDRYSRALTRAGILQTDMMAEFKANWCCPGWGKMVPALQADDPKAALEALRAVSMTPPPGPLAATIHSYLELRRGLGLNGDGDRYTLLELDRYMQTQGVTSLEGITAALLEQWIKPMVVITAVRLNKTRRVKKFFDYLRSLRLVANNPVPYSLLAVGKQQNASAKPFIFSKEQLAAILNAARRLPDSKQFPCRAQTCSTMLILLSALALRHGEVRRLRLRDVDLDRQTLFINQTKFHKSRYVPFGPKVGQCLEQFLKVRQTALVPAGENELLFQSPRTPLVPPNYVTLYKAFNEILRDLGITAPQGQRSPRIHDLRHTFAVNRLLRWYREGADVQNRLSMLSVFMGHVDVHSTQVYLTITGDLLQEANRRFHRYVASALGEEVLQ